MTQLEGQSIEKPPGEGWLGYSIFFRNMSMFTMLRDTNPVFDRMKKIGDVGIPAFVFEDGRVSLDPADAGLIEYGSAGACSLEDHKSGRKGC